VANRPDWRAYPISVVILSLAVFAFFVYSGSTVSPTHCGIPCNPSSGVLQNSLSAQDEYLAAVAAVLFGQPGLALVALTRRSRQTTS